jgi:hypothetical protein
MTLSAPAATDEFYLDNGEVVVPFIRSLQAAGTQTNIFLRQLQIGKL